MYSATHRGDRLFGGARPLDPLRHTADGQRAPHATGIAPTRSSNITPRACGADVASAPAAEAAPAAYGSVDNLRRATQRDSDTAAIPSRAAACDRFGALRRATRRMAAFSISASDDMVACSMS